jgi:hypothetical protein
MAGLFSIGTLLTPLTAGLIGYVERMVRGVNGTVTIQGYPLSGPVAFAALSIVSALLAEFTASIFVPLTARFFNQGLSTLVQSGTRVFSVFVTAFIAAYVLPGIADLEQGNRNTMAGHAMLAAEVAAVDFGAGVLVQQFGVPLLSRR